MAQFETSCGGNLYIALKDVMIRNILLMRLLTILRLQILTRYNQTSYEQ